MNLYHNVHRGLRAVMAATLSELGRVDPEDPTALATLRERVAHVLDLLAMHARIEEKHFHPALEQRAPGCTLVFEHQHHDLAQLEALLAQHSETSKSADPSSDLQELYRRFALLLADSLYHFEREESVLGAIFQKQFSLAELSAIQVQLIGDMAAEELLKFMEIVLPAIAPQSRRALVERLRLTRSAQELEPLRELLAAERAR